MKPQVTNNQMIRDAWRSISETLREGVVSEIRRMEPAKLQREFKQEYAVALCVEHDSVRN